MFRLALIILLAAAPWIPEAATGQGSIVLAQNGQPRSGSPQLRHPAFPQGSPPAGRPCVLSISAEQPAPPPHTEVFYHFGNVEVWLGKGRQMSSRPLATLSPHAQTRRLTAGKVVSTGVFQLPARLCGVMASFSLMGGCGQNSAVSDGSSTSFGVRLRHIRVPAAGYTTKRTFEGLTCG